MDSIPTFVSTQVRPYNRMSLPDGFVNVVVWDEWIDGFAVYNNVRRVYVKDTDKGIRWTLSRKGEQPVVIDPKTIMVWDDAHVQIASFGDIEGEYGHLFPGGFSV